MYQLPVGELVKIMERGVITLPSRYRKKLDLKKGELVNVLPVGEEALLVMPVEIVPKGKGADWTKDGTAEYMKKVRYNLVEKLRAESARKAW